MRTIQIDLKEYSDLKQKEQVLKELKTHRRAILHTYDGHWDATIFTEDDFDTVLGERLKSLIDDYGRHIKFTEENRPKPGFFHRWL